VLAVPLDTPQTIANVTRPENSESLTAEKMLFSPLSSIVSISTISSIVDEMNQFDPKSEVEYIQRSNLRQSDSDLEEDFMKNLTQSSKSELGDIFEGTDADRPHLQHRDMAYVAVLFLTVLCLFCYVGLILWRKSLEKRYGGLERLITEDDFSVDVDDV